MTAEKAVIGFFFALLVLAEIVLAFPNNSGNVKSNKGHSA